MKKLIMWLTEEKLDDDEVKLPPRYIIIIGMTGIIVQGYFVFTGMHRLFTASLTGVCYLQ